MVRGHRRRQGLSQEELAEAAGVNARSIRKIETGRTDVPRPATARLLADALKLSGDDRDRFLRTAAGESAVPDATVPRQLPADVYGFSGRVAELDELDAMLPNSGSRPSAVVISAIGGTAGVGKTALAVHWAHRVADQFPDGQLYVNLHGFDPSDRVMQPAEAVRGFLDALGVQRGQIPAATQAQYALYRSLLAVRRMLVVLDNARDAEHVRPLLPGTATALVVVTSRNQLTSLVAAEGARPLSLGLLSAQDARELLAGRVGAGRVAGEPQAVDSIIAACARLPLALAIAAARAAQTGFPLATLATELGEAGRRLDTLDAGDPVTQVRTVFSWSYRTLSPSAARLFRLLGLHSGPDISVAAAASFAGCPLGEARELLTELVRLSLLTEHTPGRYTRHDLLRAYATELANAEDSDADRQNALIRLLDHYTHTAYAANRHLNPTRPAIMLPLTDPDPTVSVEHFAGYQQAMDWLSAEHEVLVATVRHTGSASDAGFDTRAWQLVWSMNNFLYHRGYRQCQVDVWQYALDSAHRLGDKAAQADAHRYLADTFMELRRFDDARRHWQRALEIFTDLNHPDADAVRSKLDSLKSTAAPA